MLLSFEPQFGGLLDVLNITGKIYLHLHVQRLYFSHHFFTVVHRLTTLGQKAVVLTLRIVLEILISAYYMLYR